MFSWHSLTYRIVLILLRQTYVAICPPTVIDMNLKIKQSLIDTKDDCYR